MQFQSDTYRDVQTVVFAGTTFSFAALDTGPSGYGICYTFIETQQGSDADDAAAPAQDTDPDSAGAEAAGQQLSTPPGERWTVPAALEFPSEIRRVGMALLTEPAFDPDTGAPSTSEVLADKAPFTLVVDNDNLWVFRIGDDLHSILVDRFLFDAEARQLVKANEVRFIHSSHPDLPANEKDRYGAVDPIGDPFVEPTFRLVLDASITSEPCAVLLVPDMQKSRCARWHIVARQQNGGDFLHYDIAYTPRAWFDLSLLDHKVNNSLEILHKGKLRLEGFTLKQPTLILYEQQEMAFTAIGEAQMVQRASRALMISQAWPAQGGDMTFAAIDMALGVDGMLARLPDHSLGASTIAAYQTALSFDGRGDCVELNPGNSFALSGDGLILSAWIRWAGANAAATPQSVAALYGANGTFTLEIDGNGQVYFFAQGARGIKINTPMALVPGQWVNLTASITADDDSETCRIRVWINGAQVQNYGASVTKSLQGQYSLALGKTRNAAGDWEHFFAGEMGQFYISVIPQDANSLPGDAVYGSSAAGLDPASAIFWSFSEGEGNSVANDNTALPAHTGNIVGAIWVPAVCPDQSTMPVVYLDQQGLDTRVAVLSPSDPGSPKPRPQEGQRPALMRSADGFIHLYFQDLDRRASALHMSTETQRARFALFQKLDADGDGKLELVNVMTLVARRAGTVWGRVIVNLGQVTDGLFAQVTFTSAQFPRMNETWKKLPTRIDLFAKVINGEAVQGQADDAQDQALGALQYDYIANLTISDPTDGSTLTLDGPQASRLFEAIVPEVLLNRATVPELQGQDGVTQYVGAGNDPGWTRMPIPPALKLSGGAGVNGRAAPAQDLDIAGDLTLQCWIQLNATGAGTIVNYTGAAASYALMLDGSGRVSAQRTGFSSADMTGISRTATQALPVGTWAHLAAAYESSYALHFLPGVYVECKGAADFNLSDAFTIESWVKLDAGSSGKNTIVSRRSFEENASAFELSVSSEPGSTRHTLRLDVALANGVAQKYQGDFTYAPDTWVHLAAAFHADTSRNYLALQDEDHNCITLGNPTQQALATFTVELHIRVRDSERQCFVSFDRSEKGGSYDTVNYFQIGYLNTSASSQCLSIQLEDNQIDISTKSWDPKADKWRTLSVVVETDAGHADSYVSVYVDGGVAQLKQDGAAALRVRAPRALTLKDTDAFRPWTLGAEWDKSGKNGHYVDMDVMEFRLWSEARSHGDILNTVDAPLINDEPGLVRYVVFDSEEGSGSRTVIDRVSGDTFPIIADQSDRKIRWHAQPKSGRVTLFADGLTISSTSVAGPNNTMARTSTPLTMGRRAHVAPGGSVNELAGSLDEVRIWGACRSGPQLDYFRQNPLPAVAQQPNLVAYWKFDKVGNATIEDVAGGHTAKIKGLEFVRTAGADALWEPSVFGADWTIHIDGAPVLLEPRAVLNAMPANPPPAQGLNVGCGTQLFASCINAYLNELQIWARARLPEEIFATRNQPEVPGDELMGYYRCNDGAGNRASDLSGHDADLELCFKDSATSMAHAWVAWERGTGELKVPAPVRDEALFVINVSNGYAYPEAKNLSIAGSPSVVDDPVSGTRVYGWCSADPQEAGALSLSAELPLAATELVYLGQIQYRPQLVGYIEGAPPVPSENLTVDTSGTPDRYVNTSSTKLSLSSGTAVTTNFGAGFDINIGSSSSSGLAFETKSLSQLGTFAGAAVGGYTGFSATTADSTSSVALNLAVSADTSFAYTFEEGLSMSKAQTYGANLAGSWENMCYQIAGDVANPFQIAGLRLYRPNNMGTAVVKSRTADLYALRSSRTKAMLGYKAVALPEIPEDINIINFKLNPRYVHNGSLDGYIGFDHDRYYRDMSVGRKGSYFKPEQAYRLKRTIEREAQRAAADDSQQTPNGAAQYSNQLSSLGLVNTYVWTADSGTYAEEQSAASSYSEQYSGGGELSGMAGYGASSTIALGWGILSGTDISLDRAVNAALQLRYSHVKENTRALTLSSVVNTEGFLNRVATFADWSQSDLDTEAVKAALNASTPIPTDDSGNSLYAAFAKQGISLTEMNRIEVIASNSQWRLSDLYVVYDIALSGATFTFTYVPAGSANSQYVVNYDYGAPPCPGKVRGYRYMSMYLAADKDNFDALFAEGEDQLIDPQWLASDDPDAVALRQAKQQKNAAWRVLHRVTYVSRVPPTATDWVAAQAPADSLAIASPPLRPDDHSIHHNAVLIQQVIAGLPDAQVEAARQLDLHELQLKGVDMKAVAGTLEGVLDRLAIKGEVRRSYMRDMLRFFELLFMPDTRQKS